MSGFSPDWLRLREPFDAAARTQSLAHGFVDAITRPGRPVRIIDLGAGSGANFRVLAPLLCGDQDWLLVDHDALLLTVAIAEISRWAARKNWRCSESDGGLMLSAGA